MTEENSNATNNEICKNWGYLNDMPNDKEKSDAFNKAKKLIHKWKKMIMNIIN